MKDLGVFAILGANRYGLLFVPVCDAMGDFMLRLVTEWVYEKSRMCAFLNDHPSGPLKRDFFLEPGI
jgi:hypothetical protein